MDASQRSTHVFPTRTISAGHPRRVASFFEFSTPSVAPARRSGTMTTATARAATIPLEARPKGKLEAGAMMRAESYLEKSRQALLAELGKRVSGKRILDAFAA